MSGPAATAWHNDPARRRKVITPARLASISLLRQAPRLTIALLTVPVLAGLAGTVMPAFGVNTGDGRTAFQALAD